MNNKIILIIVVMNKHLLFLLLINCIKWINKSIFELERIEPAPFKDCRKDQFFEEISIWDYVKLI